MSKLHQTYCAVIVISLLILLETCDSTPKIPVNSKFLGETISTTVDSEVARYYLENYLQGSRLNPVLDVRIGEQRWLFNTVVWYQGWNKDKMLSMSAKQSRDRFERLNINKNILVINYMGLPLSGQLSKYSKDKYPLLASKGPNDGLTLLRDVIAPNSLTIIALGRDHFFAEDPKINAKTIALTILVISYLDDNYAP